VSALGGFDGTPTSPSSLYVSGSFLSAGGHMSRNIARWGCPTTVIIACQADVAPVPGGDGTVDIDDLVAVITSWGISGPGDVNADSMTNIDDLVLVITSWGPCPAQ
jgi:hypothetical protein